MPDTAIPYVWLQAASDAEMSDHATVIQIIISGSGASNRHPLIVVDNGWTYPHGTQVILGNVGGGTGNDFLRGGTFLISDTPVSGQNTSYFGTGVNYSHPNGTIDYAAGTASGTGNFAKLRAIEDGSSNFAFYITDLDGTDLDANVAATTDVQGVASVVLEDGDPRKIYGLPYHFISHDGFSWPVVGDNWNESTYADLGRYTDETISFTEDDYPWISTTIKSPINFFTTAGNPIQNGNLQSGKNLNAKNLATHDNQGIPGSEGAAREVFNYRTKWDWIADHTGSPSEWPDLFSGETHFERHATSGYGYGDPTTLFKRVNAKVWRVGVGSTSGNSSTHYGAEIEFDSDHHLEVGQIFTTREMSSATLTGLSMTLSDNNTGSDITLSVVTGEQSMRFRVKFVIGPRCIRTYETKGTEGGVTYGKFVTVSVGQVGRFDLYGKRTLTVSNGSATHSDEFMNTPSRLPTTTRFQLHAESIRHTFSDNVSVSPMVKSGGRSSIYEQLQMLGVNVGMRNEAIEISGTLVDRGIVSASNLRKQIFLNIARTQWLKIMGFWGGKKKNELDDGGIFGNVGTDTTIADLGFTHKGNDTDVFMSKGLGYAGALNPRSYVCLTIFNPTEQSSTDGKKVDVNPDGGYNIYRGIIKSLSFSEEGGRPNILTWRMSFEIISNEKLATSLLMDRD